MQTRTIALVMGLISLTACSKSLDERFEQACAEQRDAGGIYAEASKGACQYGEYLPPENKEKMIELWEAVRDQQAKIDGMIEDGRAQGYVDE